MHNTQRTINTLRTKSINVLVSVALTLFPFKPIVNEAPPLFPVITFPDLGSIVAPLGQQLAKLFSPPASAQPEVKRQERVRAPFGKPTYFNHTVAHTLSPLAKPLTYDKNAKGVLLGTHTQFPFSFHRVDSDNTSKQHLNVGNEAEWSPDFKRIVYASGGGIYITDAYGKNKTFLTAGQAPQWSRDGEKIEFLRITNALDNINRKNEIFEIKLDGTGLKLVHSINRQYTYTNGVGEVSTMTEWVHNFRRSPDGLDLVFGTNYPYKPNVRNWEWTPYSLECRGVRCGSGSSPLAALPYAAYTVNLRWTPDSL
jgi:hypothetical protein